jgi:hypothetical protein
MYYRGSDTKNPRPVTIRLTRPTDTDELRRLAGRDSKPVPGGEKLVAIEEGEIRAAISLSSGAVIADPFHRTEELVRILIMRRAQMQEPVERPRRGLRRLRLASG